MEKNRKILILICLLTLLNCTPYWIKINEKNFGKVDKKFVLIDHFEDFRNKNYYFKTEVYKSGNYKIIKSNFLYDTLMKSESKFFLKDSLILKYQYSGLDALVYPENINGYAKISELQYYFKNGKSGIIKERQVEINSYDEYERGLKRLKQEKFTERKLTKIDIAKVNTEYKNIIGNFD